MRTPLQRSTLIISDVSVILKALSLRKYVTLTSTTKDMFEAFVVRFRTCFEVFQWWIEVRGTKK